MDEGFRTKKLSVSVLLSETVIKSLLDLCAVVEFSRTRKKIRHITLLYCGGILRIEMRSKLPVDMVLSVFQCLVEAECTDISKMSINKYS